jgi:hypothetical protein
MRERPVRQPIEPGGFPWQQRRRAGSVGAIGNLPSPLILVISNVAIAAGALKTCLCRRQAGADLQNESFRP